MDDVDAVQGQIARTMITSGDWVTPRLDGNPWFEKPPLLYWTTALGRLLHLPDEWAARLPVALASLAFLIFFFEVVAREFSPRTAVTATAILSTSAGWLAYSFAAVTDLLMSVTLGAAMFIALFDSRRKKGYGAGALLGLSILAKAFVPLVLFAPLFLVARGKRLAIMAGCLLVAAPWHILCSLRNGMAFWQDYFWKQQVLRFFTPALLHPQPFWYFVPVLLAGLFPWTALAGLLLRPKTYGDVRVQSLVWWLIYALVFFSVARNKLPGYALPLMPALAIVLAFGLEKAGLAAKWWLSASALTLVLVPAIVQGLPEALLSGVTKVHMALAPALPFVAVAGIVWWLAWRERNLVAILVASSAALVGFAYVKVKTFPMLDQRVSVRQFWREHQSEVANACVQDIGRSWQYGLNYYARHPLPECDQEPGVRITAQNGRLTVGQE